MFSFERSSPPPSPTLSSSVFALSIASITSDSLISSVWSVGSSMSWIVEMCLKQCSFRCRRQQLELFQWQVPKASIIFIIILLAPLELQSIYQCSGSRAARTGYFWTFGIRDNFFTDPDPAYSLEYNVNTLKMSSMTLLYFFSFVLRGINVPLWRLTELFSLRIGATRWVGSRSGSTKNLTDTEYCNPHYRT